MKISLIIGFGNPDREDDGVAWHILRALTIKLGLPSPDSYEDEFPEFPSIDLVFYLQLTPEMAEDINEYEYVCFVDAHTGPVTLDSVPGFHHLQKRTGTISAWITPEIRLRS